MDPIEARIPKTSKATNGSPDPRALPDMLFRGAGGNDALVFELDVANTGPTYNQTYAVGDGTDGGGAGAGTAEGEIRTEVDGGSPSLNLYFTGPGPITTSGTPDGTLTVIGDPSDNVLAVVDSLDNDGYTQIQAAASAEIELSLLMPRDPFEKFDFQAGAFTQLVINTLEGDDLVNIQAFEDTESALTLATVNAGPDPLPADSTDDDTIILQSNAAAANIPVTINGRFGDDTIKIGKYSSTLDDFTLDEILADVTVNGQDDADVLILRDAGKGADSDDSTYAVESNSVVRTDGSATTRTITYGTIETLEIQSGTANDTFAINSLDSNLTATVLNDAGSPTTGVDIGDTLNFSGHTASSISIDLDTAAVQTVNSAGAQLQLVGQFEHFTGTNVAPGDVVYADPLSVPRTLDGGNPTSLPGDRLRFDAQGQPVTDDGTTLSVTGYAAVTHQNFETEQTVNFPPLFIDNDDLDYTDDGFTLYTGFTDAYLDDISESEAGSGKTASWTFSNIPSGLYLVSASWDGWIINPNRATNAPYSIYDETTLITPVEVNQQERAGDVVEHGTRWRELAVVEVTGNELSVELTDATANGRVVADGIRIAPFETARIIDDGDPTPDYQESGPGFGVSTDGTGAYGDHRAGNPNAGNTATYTFGELEDGYYVVSATWLTHFNRAGNAHYTLTATDTREAGDTKSTDVLVNQRALPDDFTQDGIRWENLEVVQVSGGDGSGTVTVELTDSGADGLVVADAVRLARAPEIVVLDAGTNLADGASTIDFGPTDLGDHVTKTITVRNVGHSHLLLGGVSVTGSEFSLASSPVTREIPPGGSTTFEVRFKAGNQGTFTGTVSLGNNDLDEDPFNFTVRGTASRPQPIIIDDGAAGFSAPGFVRYRGGGYAGDVRYSYANKGRTATWTFGSVDPLPTGTYQVAATWTTHRNRATNTPYQIENGAVITVNQERSPNDFQDNGVKWEILGEAFVDDGNLVVTMSTDGANQYVIADAVRIIKVDSRTVRQNGEFVVIDNVDAAYESQGATLYQQTVYSQVFGGDYQYLQGDSTGDFAKWTFSVTPGVYEVGVSWQTDLKNRTEEAPFTISVPGDAPPPSEIFEVDQTVAASSNPLGTGVVYVDGVAFQILTTTFTVPALNDTLVVTLTDDADNYVIADAVYVRKVGDVPSPLAAEGGAGPEAAAAQELTSADLLPLVTEAIARWSVTGLDAAAMEELQSAEVVITDLPGATLGLASDELDTIWIDVDAARYGWFVDPTPAVDEEFSRFAGGSQLGAVAGEAADRMDLLTVLAHELGHLLGRQDLDDEDHAHDLMLSTLATGVRRLPAASSVQEVEGDDHLADADQDGIAAGLAARDRFFGQLVETDDRDSDDPDSKANAPGDLWWLLYGAE